MSVILKSLKKKRGFRRYIGPKRVILLIGFVVLLYLIWDYYRTGFFSPAIIEQYRDNYPVSAVIIFIMIYAVAVIASIPSLPLNLAAGFFWGGFLGGFYTVLGVTIGSWVSFNAARWLLGQPLAEKFDNKWASRVQHEFERSGWKFVAFARMNPIIPTSLLNYLLGLTSLSNRDFIWITFSFLLLPSIAVAYIGDALQALTNQQLGGNEIVRAILVVSAAVTFLVGIKFASKLINKSAGE